MTKDRPVASIADVLTVGLGIFSNDKRLTYYANNEDDPYITLKDVKSVSFPFDGRMPPRQTMKGKNFKYCHLITLLLQQKQKTMCLTSRSMYTNPPKITSTCITT